jgi:hypothetical protein
VREDRELLLRFTTGLENHVFQPLVTRHLHLLRIRSAELIPAAWREVRVNIARLREWLSVRANAVANNVDAALTAAGLTGIQLRMKVEAFFEALDRAVGTRRNAMVRWYREALAWANVILGSLVRAYPDAEPIKEFKEFMEAGLDYTGAASRF